MNNVTLENARNFAFLANKSYDSEAELKSEQQQPLINPATKSSFEVVAQVNDDTTGFSGTVFKDPVSGEYTIAFRGTEKGNGKISA
ncbi:hypothetical protein [Campylobacter sp.]|uniref:hypothetical protein n=1 Tax=Campylobacter sp. TaxID=205 RepID=UPI002A7F4667|nr:hypothetical protein [Campylobacter sp.]MDY4154562.1 hypothetical protein [Campylobacter sp.]